MTIEAPVSSPAEPEPAPPPSRALEVTIQVAGAVIAVLAAIFSALLELFLTPLRVGAVPVGAVSILAAAVVNLGISWFATAAVGRRWALGPPWAVWTAIMFFAAGVRTTEGDYLLGADNWVALVMILVGSLTFAGYMYRLILKGTPVTKQ